MNLKDVFTPVPQKKNATGDQRQVGFELEYAGINLDDTSALIANVFGGRVVRPSTFTRKVTDTEIGTFSLELDMPVLKNEVYKDYLDAFGIVLDPEQMKSVEEILDGAASSIVPYEVVLPPLPLSNLMPVEVLREEMRKAGAKGTRAAMTNAFGLHINPELPGVEVDVLKRHLQAFLLLEDWIRVEAQIDWTRRLTPFVNPFPKSYQRLILRESYQPNWESFMADYLAYNKTRYRSLDLLPAFAWIDSEGFGAAFKDADRIGSRPTFHYRLPNCKVGDPTWRIAHEWHLWALVERLADQAEELNRLLYIYEVSERTLEHERNKVVRRFYAQT